ncbi:MAG: DNA starvation/stationary phase protection protein [Cyclobacteriaceae bacterium]
MSHEKLYTEVNQLLSDLHIYYQNTRGFHWNIKGKRFFELHVKFEELYTEALTNIDDIAERLLAIGGQPLHTFQDYLNTSNIEAVKGVSKDEEAVTSIVDQLAKLVKQEEVVKAAAIEAEDSETEDMMIALINAQQKHAWMFKSWLD